MSFSSPAPLGVLMKTSYPMTSLLVRHWLSVHVLNTANAFIYVFIYLKQASNANNILWITLSIYDGICFVHLWMELKTQLYLVDRIKADRCLRDKILWYPAIYPFIYEFKDIYDKENNQSHTKCTTFTHNEKNKSTNTM